LSSPLGLFDFLPEAATRNLGGLSVAIYRMPDNLKAMANEDCFSTHRDQRRVVTLLRHGLSPSLFEWPPDARPKELRLLGLYPGFPCRAAANHLHFEPAGIDCRLLLLEHAGQCAEDQSKRTGILREGNSVKAILGLLDRRIVAGFEAGDKLIEVTEQL
jgi:hypothetical protein